MASLFIPTTTYNLEWKGHYHNELFDTQFTLVVLSLPFNFPIYVINIVTEFFGGNFFGDPVLWPLTRQWGE